MDPVKRMAYHRYEAGARRTIDAGVVAEAEVTLSVNGAAWLSFLCTPIDLEALAVGFLHNEGLLASRAEIESVRVCGLGDTVEVVLTHAVERPLHWRRTSGCAGGMTADPTSVQRVAPATIANGGLCLSPARIMGLIGQLFEAQDLYRIAGGVHTSLLSDGEKTVVCVEDIGRHNTFDKIVGHCLLEEVAPAHRILLTTGRISSEMLQKAARFDAAFVISRSSPTSLAVELAERSGVTLIGYASRDRFTVYAHGERIADGGGGSPS
jgi:FdhD protein